MSLAGVVDYAELLKARILQILQNSLFLLISRKYLTASLPH